jgi:hypothetical protein
MKYPLQNNPKINPGNALRTLFIILTVTLGVSLTAGAATKTWLPTTGGAWTTASNWSGGIVPVTGDDVIINSDQTSNITGVPAITLNSLTVTGNCLLACASPSGKLITITSSFYVASGVTCTMGATSARIVFTLSAGGVATIAGNFAFDGGTGTVRQCTINGTLIVLPTGRVYDPILSVGSGFTLTSGATLKIGKPGGIIAGGQTVQNTNVAICFGGACSYNAGANYEYIGISAQVTGAGLPATVGSLTINNPAGVTLSAAKAITNTLAINNSAILNLGTFTTSTAGRLSFNGTAQATGTWGYTGSGATNINTTYFGNNTGRVTVANATLPACSINLSSAANTDNQAYCFGQAIIPITYATTTATGATVTGLPSGVTGSWSSNVLTISGTPTVSGFYTYKVTLTGGACTTTKTGTLNSDVSLRYTSPNVFNPSTLITPLNPTFNGTATVTSYSISPDLTAATGLSFSTSTGIISGTTSATPVGSATYTVTANLSCGGSISFGVVIAVGNYRYAVATGNWNSTATWAATSGGTAGASIPTSGDDVYIGEGSTSYTVTIPTGTSAVCNNLNIGLNAVAGVITLAASSSNLTVYGDLSMNVPTAAVTSAINVNAGTLNVNGNAELSNDPNTNEASTATLINQINITTGIVNISGNLIFSALNAAQSQIIFTGAGALNLAGNFLVPASLGTLTPGTTSTVNFNGTTAAQNIPIGLSAITYNNLTINNTHASGATISAAISATNVTGNLSVASGTFNNGGLAIVGNVGKTFSVSNGASFLVSGTTSTFPSGFGTNTLGATSTVNYTGSGDQTIFDVASPGYGHLILSTGGTKTVATNGLDVQGNVTISAGATFAAASFTSNIQGNWINNGSFTANTSTINFNGSSTISGSATNSFNILSIAGSSSLTGPASGTINVAGNYSNSGTFTHNSGTVTFNGSGAQSIISGGSSFNNFSITNTGGTCTASTNGITVAGTFTTAASTILDMGANVLSVVTVAHSGTVKTQNTSTTPVTTGKTWGGNVIYNANAGQTVMAGTYNNLTIDGTGTNSKKASGDITVNGILNLLSANASATQGALEMVISYGTYPGRASDYSSYNSLSSYTLYMGPGSTTAGTGDVTGIVKRDYTIAANTSYSFGNQFTNFAFTTGTMPTALTVVITIGTTPIGPSNTDIVRDAVKRTYEILATGGSACAVSGNLHYLTSELTSSITSYTNTESKLTTMDYDIGPGGAAASDEHGRVSFDAVNKSIGVSGIPITYFQYNGTSHNWRTIFVLRDFYESHVTWNGSQSTAWTDPLNWTLSRGGNAAPNATSFVVIPDASTTPNDPVLASGVTVNNLTIESGGVLIMNSETLTISPSISGGWEDDNAAGNDPGTSTVVFAANATVAGNARFYNMTINGGATLTHASGSYVKIANTVTKTGTWNTDVSSSITTVEYNGGPQTVVLPDISGGSSTNYHSLKLSGSGVKTMPGSAMVLDGDFEIASTATASAGNNITNGGNFTVGSGTSFTTGAFQHSIGGNFSNSGTFAATGSEIILNGSSAQIIGGSAATTFNHLTLNNTAGVNLNSVDATVNGDLTLTNGKITTGSNTLILGNGANVYNAGAGKYVYGNLQKGIAASTVTKIFEIGNAANYLPTTITFSGAGTTNGTGNITCNTSNGQHPNYATSGLSQTQYLNRYWTITNSGVTFGTYAAEFTFDAGDIDGGAAYGSMVVGKYSGGTWTLPTTGTNTSSTIITTGNASFSDFVAGEIPATSADYYRSVITGNWSNTGSWEWSHDGLSWNTASLTAPTNAATSITIQSGHTITIDATATAGDLVIAGTLTSGSGINLSVNGNWANSGTFNAGTGTVTFGTTVISGVSTNSFNNLTFTGTLTAPSSNMNVAGNWSNSGTFIHNNGTVSLNGTSTQSIDGSSSTTFNNLTAYNTAGVNINKTITVDGNFLVTNTGVVDVKTGTTSLGGSATMTIDPQATFQVSTGATASFGARPVTIKSDASGTGAIGIITGTITGASYVTAERWIPLRQGVSNGGRAYRALTPTVTTTSTIQANWMEGGQVTAVGGTNNPVPNYGTHITGTGGNSNGFDVTQTNQSSLYTFTNGQDINGTIGYPAVTNVTTGSILDAKTGYFLYLRGDRAQSMQVPYAPAGGMPTSSTTLRATGTLQTGDVAFTISGTTNDFSMITNPYPARLDWAAIYAANSNISTSYTMWDPNMGTEGAFVTVLSDGTNVSGSAANRYIQPGQAFFVQKVAGGTTTVNITEAMKVLGNNNNGIFRLNTPYESFVIELYLTEANSYRHTADGVMVKNDNSYNPAVDWDDADEINNWNENIAISRDGHHLAIEARPVILVKDTIPLFMNGMRQTNYELVFTPSMFSNTALKAELIDNFLNTRTLLSVTDSVAVPFSITNDPASSDTNRFMIVFGPQSPLAIDGLTISARAKAIGVQVDWTNATETNMDRYELERSFTGNVFTKINTTVAIGNSTVAVNYNFTDAQAQLGNNFYRIRAISKTGQVKISEVVKVTFGTTSPSITVAPNPITGNVLNLQLSNLEKGRYTIVLYNNLAQQVFAQQFDHGGGSATRSVTLSNAVTNGIYKLVLVSENGTRIVKPLIKN